MFTQFLKRFEDFYDVYPDLPVVVDYKKGQYSFTPEIHKGSYTLQLNDTSKISVSDLYKDLLVCEDIWHNKIRKKSVQFMLNDEILKDVTVTHIYPGKDHVVINLM